MEVKKPTESTHQPARNLAPVTQPAPTRMLRTEIDRQLGRHLIEAERKEQIRRGIK